MNIDKIAELERRLKEIDAAEHAERPRSASRRWFVKTLMGTTVGVALGKTIPSANAGGGTPTCTVNLCNPNECEPNLCTQENTCGINICNQANTCEYANECIEVNNAGACDEDTCFNDNTCHHDTCNNQDNCDRNTCDQDVCVTEDNCFFNWCNNDDDCQDDNNCSITNYEG